MNEFPETRPEPPQADAIAGEFLTERFDYDDGRQVTAYVPPGTPEAIVFAGDGQRFAAHERFFVEDVGAWARSRFGVTLPFERTAVFGVSASGELALALGLRHPELYGAIFSASPGGRPRCATQLRVNGWPPERYPRKANRSVAGIAASWRGTRMLQFRCYRAGVGSRIRGRLKVPFKSPAGAWLS